MIQVKIRYQDQNVNEIVMNGHANYDESGKDIVCAAASSIAITSVNGIEKLCGNVFDVTEDDGYLKITNISNQKEVQTLMFNMLDLLNQLEEQYPKYINIKSRK